MYCCVQGKGKKLDMKDPLLVELMTKKNKEQVKATSAEYKKVILDFASQYLGFTISGAQHFFV
jgi:hypothetical protein